MASPIDTLLDWPHTSDDQVLLHSALCTITVGDLRSLRASLTRAEAALDAFWRHHRCHRIGDSISYCGFCDGADAADDASWKDAPHEEWCAFANVLSRESGET